MSKAKVTEAEDFKTYYEKLKADKNVSPHFAYLSYLVHLSKIDWGIQIGEEETTFFFPDKSKITLPRTEEANHELL